MGRVAQSFVKTKLTTAAVVLFLAGGTIIGLVQGHDVQPRATVETSQSQINDVKYQGIAGQTALALLEKYTTVQVKHYSFGDLVTAINGTAGNGPKYWSFYLNGKLADVGAGSYLSKNTDQIEWKLQ